MPSVSNKKPKKIIRRKSTEGLAYKTKYDSKPAGNSPFTGVRFPEGTQRIVFEQYVANNGSFPATRRILKRLKLLPGGRSPTIRTMRLWAQDNHWDVLRDMVDDGLMSFLELEGDPDIKEAIKDDGTYFKVLLRLRSQVALGMMKKNSVLMPRNAKEAVAALKFVSDEMDTVNERISRTNKKTDARSQKTEEKSDKIVDIASRMAKDGKPVTESEVARQMIRDRS